VVEPVVFPLHTRGCPAGEDDSLNRIPLARYQRIFNRAQPVTLDAGKSLRFIEAIVERDDDGNEELVNASFLRHQFDEHGLWDKKEKDQRIRGVMEAVSAVGKGAYMEELSRIQHIDPFRWKPTAELVGRLLTAIRTKKRHT
jgi:hypothetical protein